MNDPNINWSREKFENFYNKGSSTIKRPNDLYVKILEIKIENKDGKNIYFFTITDGMITIKNCVVILEQVDTIVKDLKVNDIVKISQIVVQKDKILSIKVAEKLNIPQNDIILNNYNIEEENKIMDDKNVTFRTNSILNRYSNESNQSKNQGKILQEISVNNSNNKINKYDNTFHDFISENKTNFEKAIIPEISELSIPYSFEIFKSKSKKDSPKNKENLNLQLRYNNNIDDNINNNNSNKKAFSTKDKSIFSDPIIKKKRTYRYISQISNLEREFKIKFKVLDISYWPNNEYVIIKDEIGTIAKLIIFDEKLKNICRLDRVYMLQNGNFSDIKLHSVSKIPRYHYKYFIRVDQSTNSKIEEIPDDNSINSQLNFVPVEEILHKFENYDLYINLLVYIFNIEDIDNPYHKKKIIVSNESLYLIDILIIEENFEKIKDKIKIGEVFIITSLEINFKKGFYLRATKNTFVEIITNKQSENIKKICQNSNENSIRKHNEIFKNFGKTPIFKMREMMKIFDEHVNKKFDVGSSKRRVNLYESIDNIENRYKLIRAYFTRLDHKESNVYVGCQRCKVIFDGPAPYLCKECHSREVDNFYYYKLPIEVRDETDGHTVFIINEMAEDLLGIPAKEYLLLVLNKNIEYIQKQLDEINRRFLFKREFFFMFRLVLSKYEKIKEMKVDKRIEVIFFDDVKNVENNEGDQMIN